MRRGWPCALAVALAAVGVAAAAAAPGPVSFSLPSSLTEISGLAAAGPSSVFAHDDEMAIVYELDLGDGHVRRAFALGKPTIEGDFEGIAALGGELFLVSSDGLIYRFRPGRHGTRVPYRVHDSGIGARCEVEGLSASPYRGELLILCKRARGPDDGKKLELYRWRVGADRAEAKPMLSIPAKRFLTKEQRAEFAPSGLEWDPARRQLLVVSARNRLLMIFDLDGRLLSKRALARDRHPHVEGVALVGDGRLVLSDEGTQIRRARLSAYPFP